MKIEIEEYKDPYNGEGYGSSSLTISVATENGKGSVSFGGGEPEDFCLARDLSDAYSIKDLLILAYSAGKSGEALEITDQERSSTV